MVARELVLLCGDTKVLDLISTINTFVRWSIMVARELGLLSHSSGFHFH